jgi:hypothetical protein
MRAASDPSLAAAKSAATGSKNTPQVPRFSRAPDTIPIALAVRDLVQSGFNEVALRAVRLSGSRDLTEASRFSPRVRHIESLKVGIDRSVLGRDRVEARLLAPCRVDPSPVATSPAPRIFQAYQREPIPCWWRQNDAATASSRCMVGIYSALIELCHFDRLKKSTGGAHRALLFRNKTKFSAALSMLFVGRVAQ